jgi:hypothetical protein
VKKKKNKAKVIDPGHPDKVKLIPVHCHLCHRDFESYDRLTSHLKGACPGLPLKERMKKGMDNRPKEVVP